MNVQAALLHIGAADEALPVRQVRGCSGFYRFDYGLNAGWGGPQAKHLRPSGLMNPRRHSQHNNAIGGAHGRSELEHHVEPAPEHPLAIAGHILGIHQLLRSWVAHHLGHDAVAVRTGLE